MSNTLILDEDTKALLINLVLYLIVGTTILLGWLILRKCRGDKQNVNRHMSE